MKTNADLQKGVQEALKWEPLLSAAEIGVSAQEGIVTLSGTVDSYWKKTEAAKNAVTGLLGVAGVTNNIAIKANTLDEIERKDIERALERNWSLSSREIKVTVSGAKVTLTGTVDSWYRKSEAARIARKAPGVAVVENDLVVDYAYEQAD